jgi:hypothetical protein
VATTTTASIHHSDARARAWEAKRRAIVKTAWDAFAQEDRVFFESVKDAFDVWERSVRTRIAASIGVALDVAPSTPSTPTPPSSPSSSCRHTCAYTEGDDVEVEAEDDGMAGNVGLDVDVDVDVTASARGGGR